MAQQFHNGGKHDGSRTISNRDTRAYAVVNTPFCGKHRKTEAQRAKRHAENIKKRQTLISKTSDII